MIGQRVDAEVVPSQWNPQTDHPISAISPSLSSVSRLHAVIMSNFSEALYVSQFILAEQPI